MFHNPRASYTTSNNFTNFTPNFYTRPYILSHLVPTFFASGPPEPPKRICNMELWKLKCYMFFNIPRESKLCTIQPQTCNNNKVSKCLESALKEWVGFDTITFNIKQCISNTRFLCIESFICAQSCMSTLGMPQSNMELKKKFHVPRPYIVSLQE
jgi:hypothetical protein